MVPRMTLGLPVPVISGILRAVVVVKVRVMGVLRLMGSGLNNLVNINWIQWELIYRWRRHARK